MDTSFVEDIDLTLDEPWESMLNPYTGTVTPSWQVMQEARMRMSTED